MAQRQKQKPAKKRNNKPVAKDLPHLIHDRFGVRIAHHKHSGQHLPLRYTSYSILFFLIAFVSLVLIYTSVAARAYVQTGQGGISLSGFSKGPPPKNAAQINAPLARSIYEQNSISVSGDCEANLFIELYRNSVLAGGAICAADGTFKLFTTLVPGKNDLQARIHDALWQYGPDSEVVTTWYNVPIPATPVLLVYTKPIQPGLQLGNEFQIEYIVSGGQPPYAASIDWGDGTVPYVAIQQKAGTYYAKHTYDRAGQYVILVNSTDELGSKALIQSVIVVHSDKDSLPGVGSGGCTGSACSSGGLLGVLDWSWPTLLAAGMMTLSFWVGEKVAVTHRLFRVRIP